MGLQKTTIPQDPRNAALRAVSNNQPVLVVEEKQKMMDSVKPEEFTPRLNYATVGDPKSNRILRQGVYQHALVSPALAGLQFRTADEFLAIVKDVAEKTIKMIGG